MKKSKILLTIIFVWVTIVLVLNVKSIIKENGFTILPNNATQAEQTNNTGKGLIIVANDLIPDNETSSVIAANREKLQSYVDTASESGGIVHIPAGTYYFDSVPTRSKFEEYVILCADNVTIEGEGISGTTATTLVPLGPMTLTIGGIDMFYYNEYSDSGKTNPDFLVNADFRNFIIDGSRVEGASYNSSGKGFMINLFEDCDWENVIVKGTEGTGFGMDCPINSTITNCQAIGCGRAVDEESDPGGSGFGIGTGYRNDESIHITNCISTDNGKFGFFFEHQGKFSDELPYPANTSGGFTVSNCIAGNNMYDFGGLRANDVIFENCTSTSLNSEKNVLPIRFAEHSKRIHMTNCKVTQTFADVTDVSDYYYEPIYWAVENAISDGMSKTIFGPEEDATRAQAITFLWRLAERPGEVVFGKEKTLASNYESIFEDVSTSSSYTEAVDWAVEQGIINNTVSTFLPEDGCTRAMFITFLWRYAGSPEASKTYAFTDIPSGSYYEDAINWAVSQGIATGRTETTFSPNEICKRGEIVTFIYRYATGNNKFNITYNLNGGTVSSANPTQYDAGKDSFTLVNPTKEGYTFEGWTGSNYATNVEQSNYTPQKNVKLLTTDSGNKTYTANWTPNEYIVYFYSNGGTGTMINETFTYDDLQLLSQNEFTKTGYTFAGWNTAMDGTGTSYADQEKVKNLTSEADAKYELYANWDANQVEYKVEHYKQNIDETYSVKPTETEKLTATADSVVTPSVKSYEGFTSPSVQAVIVNADGTTVIKYYYTRNSYTVFFKAGVGVENLTGNGIYKYGENVEITYDFADGYKSIRLTFAGISKDDFNNGSFVMPANNITGNIYATETFEYTITYNLNGGTETTNPTTYTVETNDIVLAEPTKEGYEFLGWTGSNGTEPEKAVTISKGSTGNKTYTANWKTIEATKYTYKVEHYKQNIDGTYPSSAFETQTLQTTETSVMPSVKTYEGFTSPNAKTQTINTSGTTVIQYYYTRNSYTVNITQGTGIENLIGNGKYKYEEPVTITYTVSAGYDTVSTTISGMFEEEYNNGSFVMPANNVTGKITATLSTYTITYNLDGGTETTNPTTYTIETNDIKLAEPTRDGYTFNGWTGSNGTEPEKEVIISKGSTGNKSYKANWTVIPTAEYTYTIEHYKQNIDETYSNIPTETEGYSCEENAVITAIRKNYEGFSSPELQTVTIDENGKIIKYYYERNSYEVAILKGNGITKVSGNGTYKYGQKVTLAFEMADGYSACEWILYGISDEDYESETNSFLMPANSVTGEVYITKMFDYTITYNLDGGIEYTNPTTYNVESEDIILAEPLKEGYEFLGWTGSNGTEPEKEVIISKGSTGDKIYTANWKKTAVPTYIYIVEHYKQNIDGTYPSSAFETQTLQTTNTSVTPEVKTYEGFTSPTAEQINVNESTTTVIKYYYIRNSYQILMNEGTGITLTGNGTYKFEEEVNVNITVANGYEKPVGDIYGISAEEYMSGSFTMPANNIAGEVNATPITYTITYNLDGGVETTNPVTYTIETNDIVLKSPTKDGYTFDGWTGSNGTVPETQITITKGSTGNKTYTANWTIIPPNNYTYTVEHYKQNLDGTYLDTATEIYTYSAEENTSVTAEQKSYDGFKTPEKQTFTITENGKVIKYYYERNSYTVSFEIGNGIKKVSGNGTYKYGEQVTINFELADGYKAGTAEFTGISSESYNNGNFAMPANNISGKVYATEMFEYTITYNLNGGIETTNPITYNIETEDIILAEPSKNGYEFTGWTGSNGTELEKEVTISKGSIGNKEYTANWNKLIVETSYVVKHYKQNIDGTYPQNPSEEENLKTTNESIMPDVKTYTGFTSPEKQTLVFETSESNIIEYYYTRNSYQVLMNEGTGVKLTGNGTYKYEEEVNVQITLIDGYENAVGDVYGISAEEYMSGNFKMPSNNIAGEVNATLITYTITYNLDGGIETTNPTTYTLETDDIVLKAPTKEGYNFTGWTGSNGDNPQESVTISKGSTGNKTYTANWLDSTITEYPYTVEHYKQNIDGTYPNAPADKEELKTIESSVTPETRTYEGFTSPEIQTVTFPHEGETVIKYYYTRNSYDLNVTKGIGIKTLTGNGTYKYGEEVNVEVEMLNGYENISYEISGIENDTYSSGKFTMPANNISGEVKAVIILYTISYNLDGGVEGGINPVKYTVESDEISLIAPTKTGYDFIGWTGSNGEEPELEVIIPKGSIGDKEYTANWRLKILPYKVEHYKQDINGEYSNIPDDTEEFKADYGTTITPLTKTYKGFKSPIEQSVVLTDETGNTIIKYYYERNSYKINIRIREGVYKVIGQDEYLYEERVALQAVRASGYSVVRWKVTVGDKTDFYAGTSIYFDMPADNVTIEVEAVKNISDIGANNQTIQLSCKVEHYLQNIDGTYPEKPNDSEIQRTILGSSAKATVKEYEGFTSPTEKTLNATIDGSGVIKYYYERNSYNVNIIKNNGIENISGNNTYKFEENVELVANEILGYENITWKLKTKTTEETKQGNKITFNMPASDLEISVYATPKSYLIIYNLNDGNVEEPNPTQYTIETDNIKLNIPTKEGYEFLGWTGSNGTEPNKEVILEKGSTGDKEYIANWKIINNTEQNPEQDNNQENNGQDNEQLENDNTNNNGNVGNSELENNDNEENTNNSQSNAEEVTGTQNQENNNYQEETTQNDELTNVGNIQTNANSSDNLAGKVLPKAGRGLGIMLIISAISTFGVISYKKYQKYKDI